MPTTTENQSTVQEAQTIEQAAITNADTAAGGAAAADATPAVTKAPVHDEDAELARLLAEQAALDAAQAKALETGSKVSETPEKKTEAAPAAEKAAPARSTDPKDAAIIALRKQNQTLQLKLAETTGATRVLEQLVNAGHQPGDTTTDTSTAQAQTPEAKIAAIDSQILDLAQQLEDGKIDMPAYERARLQLGDQRFAIQQESVQQQRGVQPDATITDTAVQDHLSGLIKKHPYIATMTEQQLTPYQAKAMQSLQLEGKLGFGQNRDDMALRERMADLVRADMLQMLGVSGDVSTGGEGNGAKPAVSNVTQLSDAAKAREAKLGVSATHPADISKSGSPASGTALTAADAVATLDSFGGDEEAAIRWLAANPHVSALR